MSTPHFHTEAREALEAARIFLTPLERLKNWNAFKEDAARRINAALTQHKAECERAHQRADQKETTAQLRDGSDVSDGPKGSDIPNVDTVLAGRSTTTELEVQLLGLCCELDRKLAKTREHERFFMFKAREWQEEAEKLRAENARMAALLSRIEREDHSFAAKP